MKYIMIILVLISSVGCDDVSGNKAVINSAKSLSVVSYQAGYEQAIYDYEEGIGYVLEKRTAEHIARINSRD